MVLHITYGDSEGGAAIAAYRHCEAMIQAGIDARMLVVNKERYEAAFIASLLTSPLKRLLAPRVLGKARKLVIDLFKPWGVFSFPVLSVSIFRHPWVREADRIYLHWVAGSMLSTREIGRILSLGKPVVWYMHDMNPITGGCHYSMDCVGYKTGCSVCPHIGKRFLGMDIAKIQMHNRLRCWGKYQNLEAYTPSSWLASCVKGSLLWRDRKVTVFPNVFDTNKFKILDKLVARKLLQVESQKRLVLFGAYSVSSPYKGGLYLQKMLNLLDPDHYEALIFGAESDAIRKGLRIQCHFLGLLRDEYSLIMAYNAADVFVSSSLADNYPNVIMEAMACGLPCVAFRVGGLVDQIVHKQTGYLAEYKDATDLAQGVRFVCEQSDERYNQMRIRARDFVCEMASYNVYQGFASIEG